MVHTKNKTSIACDSPGVHWVRVVDRREDSVTKEGCKNGNKVAESKINLEDDHSNLYMSKKQAYHLEALTSSRFYIRKLFFL